MPNIAILKCLDLDLLYLHFSTIIILKRDYPVANGRRNRRNKHETPLNPKSPATFSHDYARVRYLVIVIVIFIVHMHRYEIKNTEKRIRERVVLTKGETQHNTTN